MRKTTFFLIDDDADDREIFLLALKEVNPDFDCVMANNGVEAIKLLTTDLESIPDYIFLDLNMPMLSGKECLKEIKNIDKLDQVPVIMYSTSSLERDFEESKVLGASHFLVKPPSILTLKSIISQLVSSNHSPFVLKGNA